jgi:riboflavin kinase/FMN adenylyltransferase
VNVAYDAARLEAVPRAVAIGTFDGVHLGHRAVVRAAVDAGLRATVVTFDPHPRLVLGRPVALLASLQRRLELLADCGVEDVLVVPFTADLAALDAEAFARAHLLAIGAQVVVAGSGFRFGRDRAGDLALLERLGVETRTVPIVEGISSTRIRSLVSSGDVEHAAELLGRPVEVEGEVVGGDQRGADLGFPTANLATPANLIVPANGIYAGASAGTRAAISIGVNPHFGGRDRRVEAFLLDWEGDLYGERLVVQVWRRLREERAFASDEELVAQIARDVEETRTATPPV